MTEFVAVCKLDELPEGGLRRFKVNGKEVVIARVAGGDCHAISARCTHLHAQLGKGALDGTDLVCPWHGSRYDVATGRVQSWVQRPALVRIAAALLPKFLRRNLSVYELKIENGRVSVRV